jgi:hypothetical protein
MGTEKKESTPQKSLNGMPLGANCKQSELITGTLKNKNQCESVAGSSQI